MVDLLVCAACKQLAGTGPNCSDCSGLRQAQAIAAKIRIAPSLVSGTFSVLPSSPQLPCDVEPPRDPKPMGHLAQTICSSCQGPVGESSFCSLCRPMKGVVRPKEWHEQVKATVLAATTVLNEAAKKDPVPKPLGDLTLDDFRRGARKVLDADHAGMVLV